MCYEEKNSSYSNSEWWWSGWGQFEIGWSREACLSQNSDRREPFPTVHLDRCLHFCLPHSGPYSLEFLLTPLVYFFLIEANGEIALEDGMTYFPESLTISCMYV